MGHCFAWEVTRPFWVFEILIYSIITHDLTIDIGRICQTFDIFKVFFNLEYIYHQYILPPGTFWCFVICANIIYNVYSLLLKAQLWAYTTSETVLSLQMDNSASLNSESSFSCIDFFPVDIPSLNQTWLSTQMPDV